jgi:hypothetical protein
MTQRLVVMACVVAMGSGCATGISAARRKGWEDAAAPATTALQAASFEEASKLGNGALAQDPENSRANAVVAVADFQAAMHDLVGDVFTIGAAVALAAATNPGFINTDTLIYAFKKADERLGAIDGKLTMAAKDDQMSLELCIACWEHDWNRNGEIDDRDRMLFQIEQDKAGNPLPPEDPRRKPTYRLDVADVHWLKALIAFQRGALNLAQGWDWAKLAPAVMGRGRHKEDDVHIPVKDAAAIKRARDFILAGLAESKLCREAALAETDDDREWLPNPRQKSYAMPLDVDDALYTTWAQVVDDGEQLVKDQTALSVTELAQLGKRQWENPPKGYIHLGKWLDQPREIVLPQGRLDDRTERVEQVLNLMFGDAYSPTGARSLLPSRGERMKAEIDRGTESLEKKLRFLFWIN